MDQKGEDTLKWNKSWSEKWGQEKNGRGCPGRVLTYKKMDREKSRQEGTQERRGMSMR